MHTACSCFAVAHEQLLALVQELHRDFKSLSQTSSFSSPPTLLLVTSRHRPISLYPSRHHAIAHTYSFVKSTRTLLVRSHRLSSSRAAARLVLVMADLNCHRNHSCRTCKICHHLIATTQFLLLAEPSAPCALPEPDRVTGLSKNRPNAGLPLRRLAMAAEPHLTIMVAPFC